MMDQATKDLQELTISGIAACCVSLRANMPLTGEQMNELNQVHDKLLAIQQAAAWGIAPERAKG